MHWHLTDPLSAQTSQALLYLRVEGIPMHAVAWGDGTFALVTLEHLKKFV